MLLALLLFTGFTLLMLLMGWAGAETRPGFLDPHARVKPFVTPIPPHGRDFR